MTMTGLHCSFNANGIARDRKKITKYNGNSWATGNITHLCSVLKDCSEGQGRSFVQMQGTCVVQWRVNASVKLRTLIRSKQIVFITSWPSRLAEPISFNCWILGIFSQFSQHQSECCDLSFFMSCSEHIPHSSAFRPIDRNYSSFSTLQIWMVGEKNYSRFGVCKK